MKTIMQIPAMSNEQLKALIGSKGDELRATLNETHRELLILANQVGACSLNGQPATLQPPDLSAGRGFWRVVTQAGRDGATFTEHVVRSVVKQQGGRFRTRELRHYACV